MDMEMKMYKIIYREVLIQEFFVEANSEEEAQREFDRMCMSCELDFSYGEVDEACITNIQEV